MPATTRRSIRGPRSGGALAVLAVIAGCGGGEEPATSTTELGGESPAEAVAVVAGVEDGTVTAAELDQAVADAALESGQDPPVVGGPEYDLLAGDALDNLIVAVWVRGEEAEGGTGVSADELESKWMPRTECLGELISRFCGNAEAEPPPDIPPASG